MVLIEMHPHYTAWSGGKAAPHVQLIVFGLQSRAQSLVLVVLRHLRYLLPLQLLQQMLSAVVVTTLQCVPPGTFIWQLLLLLLLKHRRSLQLLQRIRRLHLMRRLCSLLVKQQQQRVVSYGDFGRISGEREKSREEISFSSKPAGLLLPRLSLRLRRQLSPACLLFLQCLYFFLSCPLPDVQQQPEGPAVVLTAAPPHPTVTPWGRTAAKESRIGGVIAASASSFRSLIPPFPPAFVDPSESSRQAVQQHTDPPTLQISSADSIRCSCRTNGGGGQANSQHVAPRRLGSEQPQANNNNEEEWCCTEAEKQQALRRVFEAPAGIAFVSIGDTGEPGAQMKRTADTLARVGELVDLRFINLVGDNFYPHGVRDISDPHWKKTFESIFHHPPIQKVVFFPVLGNHDYGLNPHAQIDRYMRNRNENAAGGDLLGVADDRWRFPNNWYFTRHVFTNVPAHMTNPYNVGMNIDTAKKPQGSGQREKVVVVTVYVDTMVLIAGEFHDRGTPYVFSKDEIYRLQLDFIEAVFKVAQKDADWVFVCGHHAALTDANPGRVPPQFKSTVEELVEKYGVDAYISGHEHVLSCFRGDSATASTYIISGSASKLNGPCGCARDSCRYNSSTPGFVLHLLSKTELHNIFVDNNGQVLFTQTQHVRKRQRDDTKEIPNDVSVVAYPKIQRVYIGPFDAKSPAARGGLSPYYYFLFGALAAASCALVSAGCFWLCCVVKRRHIPITPAFWRRSHQAEDTKMCKEVLVISATTPPQCEGPEKSGAQGSDRLGVDGQPSGVPTVASSTAPRVCREGSGSAVCGTLRRSYSLQPRMESKKPATTSTSGEADRLLNYGLLSRGSRNIFARDEVASTDETVRDKRSGGTLY